MEECICYQRSYSLGLKWFHIKLGLTSSIEIKHQQNIWKELNGDLQNAQGNTTNEIRKYKKTIHMR
jgi:hypothetical protein